MDHYDDDDDDGDDDDDDDDDPANAEDLLRFQVSTSECVFWIKAELYFSFHQAASAVNWLKTFWNKQPS